MPIHFERPVELRIDSMGNNVPPQSATLSIRDAVGKLFSMHVQTQRGRDEGVVLDAQMGLVPDESSEPALILPVEGIDERVVDDIQRVLNGETDGGDFLAQFLVPQERPEETTG